MATIMEMPRIGVNMTEAVIIKWLVAEGDRVEEGQAILEVEADKSTQEVYVKTTGIIGRLHYKEGDTVQCHSPLLTILAEEETIEAIHTDDDTKNEAVKKPESTNRLNRMKISPLAKKLALEKQIDLQQLSNRFGDKLITKEDVLSLAESLTSSTLESKEKANTPKTVIPIKGIRKTIATQMSLSAATIPSVTLNAVVDVQEMIRWRGNKKSSGQDVSFNTVLIFVVSRVLGNYPLLNARLNSDLTEIHCLSEINIGLAVDTEKGLLVPVINHADQKGLIEIEQELQEKICRAKLSRSAQEDLDAGTFTITNLGNEGVVNFTPLINPHQASILGVGCIFDNIKLDEGKIKIVKNMYLSLVFDHRILDGADAARGLKAIKQTLEDPLLLLD